MIRLAAPPVLTRRMFVATGTAALALPLRPRFARAHGADAYSFAMGEAAITVISDGNLVLPASVLAPQAPAAAFQALMAETYGAVPETVAPEANHVLIRTGDDLILVDTGSGAGFQPTAGKLVAHLQANGIDPAAVTKVVYTHAHPDHIWGTLAADGALTFPNAAYFAGETEVAFWTDPATVGMLPADFRPFAEGAARDLAAVADRLTRLPDGGSVAPGVSVWNTPGHTPGHVSVMVEGGEGLIVTGDVLPHPQVSVGHPDWAFGFDADPAAATASRRALLDRAATDGHRILSYHFPWPGAGRVERAGDGYRFTPDAG